jgi:uncharacterized membrane protein
MTTSRLYRYLIFLIVIFSLVGLIDSFSIHLKDIVGNSNPSVFQSCDINSILNCETVAHSQAAYLFGVPVSLFGLMFYEAGLILSGLMLLGTKIVSWIYQLVTILILVAFIFSWHLIYVSWFGIGALCPYCLVSDASTTVITICWAILAYKEKFFLVKAKN